MVEEGGEEGVAEGGRRRAGGTTIRLFSTSGANVLNGPTCK